MTPSTLRIQPGGRIDCLYTDAIDLRSLGRLHVRRASVILFCDRSQEWKVRCATTGKLLFSHPSREECLEWEKRNLDPGR